MKGRHKQKKSGNITQNNVVYKCHYCLHQNLKRGTPKGHIKGICPSKVKPSLELTPPSKSITSESRKIQKGIASKDEVSEIKVFPSQVVAKDVTLMDTQSTSSSTNTRTLLEGKRRRQDSPLSNDIIKTTNMSGKGANSVSTSSKRRRKSWTSLKEIAQSKEDKNSQIGNLTIPFIL